MAEFTAKDVQALRQATGAGMLDAKKALEENDGDMEAAKQWLREQGAGRRGQAGGPRGHAGAVAVVRQDSVARHGRAALRDRLRGQVARVRLPGRRAGRAGGGQGRGRGRPSGPARSTSCAPRSRRTSRSAGWCGSRPARRGARHLPPHAGRPRRQRGPGRAAGRHPGAGPRLAVHIAFARPNYLRREDVPEAEVAAERATVEEISRNEGKPEAALPKIVEGRMNGWFKERCLLEQPYVHDEKRIRRRACSGRRDRAVRAGRRRLLRSRAAVGDGTGGTGSVGEPTPPRAQDVGGGPGVVGLRRDDRRRRWSSAWPARSPRPGPSSTSSWP